MSIYLKPSPRRQDRASHWDDGHDAGHSQTRRPPPAVPMSEARLAAERAFMPEMPADPMAHGGVTPSVSLRPSTRAASVGEKSPTRESRVFRLAAPIEHRSTPEPSTPSSEPVVSLSPARHKRRSGPGTVLYRKAQAPAEAAVRSEADDVILSSPSPLSHCATYADAIARLNALNAVLAEIYCARAFTFAVPTTPEK